MKILIVLTVRALVGEKIHVEKGMNFLLLSKMNETEIPTYHVLYHAVFVV